MPPVLTDQELIDGLQKFADELGRVPSYGDMEDSGPYSVGSYQNHFGSWSAALEEAGLDPSNRDTNRLSDQELIAKLVTFAAQIGRRPTLRQMEAHGPHSGQTYETRFGSWDGALEQAGFDTSVQYSRRHLINALLDLYQEVDGVPAGSDMRAKGEFSTSVYEDRFGGWRSALEEVGIESKRERQQAETADPVPKSEVEVLLAELQTLAVEVGGTPTSKDMQRLGCYSYSTYRKVFGSWRTAVEAAGLIPDGPEYKSDGELLAELRSLASDMGRTPYAHEIPEKVGHSASVYRTRFGSWNEAVKAAGLTPTRVWGGKMVECWNCGQEFRKKKSHAERHDQHFCNPECMGEWQSEHFRGEDNPRWSGGYDDYYGETWDQKRREALQRDGFECQSCGIGRADHHDAYGRDLHVHHINPIRTYANPGRANELSNLVTLCEKCHKQWEGVPLRPQLAD